MARNTLFYDASFAISNYPNSCRRHTHFGSDYFMLWTRFSPANPGNRPRRIHTKVSHHYNFNIKAAPIIFYLFRSVSDTAISRLNAIYILSVCSPLMIYVQAHV